MKLIKHHWELDVYKLSIEAAMEVTEVAWAKGGKGEKENSRL